jgi:integrase
VPRLGSVAGSIRKRGPDRWQVRVSVGRDPVTGRYRYVAREVRGSKRDAQRVATQLSSEVDHGGHQHPNTYTVAKLLDEWMTHIEAQGRAPSTLARYRSAIRANIVPALGNLRIDRLGPAQLDLYYASLTKSGLSPLTVRKSHAMLSAALNQAYKWGWIDRNPADRASPPGIRQKEIVPPTAEEIRRLLDACEQTNPDLGSLIYLALTTACRRGELCGLRWSDVDLDKATLVVARSISDAPGDVVVKGTKTHQTRRIALDPSTVEVLRRQLARAAERAQLAGVGLGPASYVWSQDLDGSTPYRPDRVTAAFVGLRNRLGLRHLTFHGLRHFAATTLAGSGLGVRTIAGRLGHANPSVTLRTYAHFLDVADREAATALGAVVAALASRPAIEPSTLASPPPDPSSR